VTASEPAAAAETATTWGQLPGAAGGDAHAGGDADAGVAGAGGDADGRAAAATNGPQLPDRLNALARLTEIASAPPPGGEFSPELLGDASSLLARAGERLRLSADHTVVALAGGTGSGKSSLFNRLAGADFSTVGVTRPVTRDAHACVWGIRGSGPLLDWLDVPRRYRYARASALDHGEQSLAGLVLLDLPDHDTVMTHASGLVDRLTGLADLMIWVLDPQKYADAAVHRRFLVPLAGHSNVLTVVLNQADLLTPAQLADCESDLRRLLDSEDLPDVQILPTSAVTGAGLEDLRKLLAAAVSERQAASARISADVDGIAARFGPYAGQPEETRPGAVPAGAVPAGAVPAGAGAQRTMLAGAIGGDSIGQLVTAFARAAGVSGVAGALRRARELRAVDYVGWPVAWVAERLTRRDPVRKVRLGQLWAELRSVTAGPSGAQQAEIDNALTDLAREVAGPLPFPWSQRASAAVRSRAPEIPVALGDAMGAALPPDSSLPRWWRVVGAWQGLLLGAVIIGAAWMAAITAFGVLKAGSNMPRLFSDVSLLPWIGAMIGALLVLGWLTASASMRQVQAAADREAVQFTGAVRHRIGAVACDLVVVPAEAELARLDRFRHELRVVAAPPA